jgi:hypothetical protein
MSTTSLTNVFRELFVAPLAAATTTEEDYRRIWGDWLDRQLKLLSDENGELKPGVDLGRLLESAPVVNLDGVIEVGITMRIASVKEFNAALQIGLSVGPIYGSGGFGFVNRTSQESVFQASTRYTISNFERNLKKYLEDRNITLAKPEDMKTAIEILRKSTQS